MKGQDAAQRERGGAVNELWLARELEPAAAARPQGADPVGGEDPRGAEEDAAANFAAAPPASESGEADPTDESRKSARLEHRAEVDGEERANYHQNFKQQRRLEREAEIKRENAFAGSLRGKLRRVPLTRWMFNRQTRRLEILIVFGLLTAILGVGLSVMHTGRELQAVQEASEGSGEQVDRSKSLGEELVRGREETQRVISEFFQAQSVEEVMALSRAPDVLKPVMTRWYQTHPLRRETIDEFKSVRIRELEGARYFLHFVRFEGDLEVRPIPVEDTGEGYRVDWETAVGYQPMDWKEYRAQRPAEPTYMRVYVQSSDYYNFGFREFRDDGAIPEWSSYRLSHPDEDRPLYGYVKSFSPLRERLDSTISWREGEYFILRLQFPEDAPADNQVHITEILQSNWVFPYKPGDVHFDEIKEENEGDSR